MDTIDQLHMRTSNYRPEYHTSTGNLAPSHSSPICHSLLVFSCGSPCFIHSFTWKGLPDLTFLLPACWYLLISALQAFRCLFINSYRVIFWLHFVFRFSLFPVPVKSGFEVLKHWGILQVGGTCFYRFSDLWEHLGKTQDWRPDSLVSHNEGSFCGTMAW